MDGYDAIHSAPVNLYQTHRLKVVFAFRIMIPLLMTRVAHVRVVFEKDWNVTLVMTCGLDYLDSLPRASWDAFFKATEDSHSITTWILQPLDSEQITAFIATLCLDCVF